MQAPIRVALVGCGHMGRHHARVVAADPGCELVAAVDLVRERAAEVVRRFGGRVAERVPSNAHAVIVATPTHSHVEVARPLLDRGAWCLIEKPLAPDVQQARELASPRCAVGHSERFNPAVRAAGDMRPQMLTVTRQVPPTGRSLDIDVVLDLMIHDLDLLLHWLPAGAEVAWLHALGESAIPAGEGVDVAAAWLRTLDGSKANLFASRCGTTTIRRVQAVEDGRRTELDLLTGEARREGHPLARVDDRDALMAQWDAFTAAIRADCPPTVHAGSAGLAALELADRIRREIACG